MPSPAPSPVPSPVPSPAPSPVPSPAPSPVPSPTPKPKVIPEYIPIVSPAPRNPDPGSFISRTCSSGTLGRQFVLAYLADSETGLSQMTLYFTTPSQGVEVSVTTGGQPAGRITVSSGHVQTVSIPALMKVAGTGKHQKVIRVSADGDIAVFSHQSSGRSCSAEAIYPVHSLGRDYYAVTWWPTDKSPERNSFITVVPSEDNTQVTLTFPPGRGIRVLSQGRQYGDGDAIMTVTLSRNDVLQIEEKRMADLSGTRVTSSRRVAVFSGNRHTGVGVANIRDMLFEQLPPVNTYGTSFVLPLPPSSANGAKVKIVSTEARTSVTISGVVNGFLMEDGGYNDWSLTPNQFVSVTASRPVLVAIYTQSSREGGAGHPTMIVVPPLNQYQNGYYFAAPASGTSLSLMVITSRRFSASVYLDNQPVSSAAGWQPVAATDLVGTWVSLPSRTSGAFRLYGNDPEARLAAFVYGPSSSCAFGYTVGMCLAGTGGVCQIVFYLLCLTG